MGYYRDADSISLEELQTRIAGSYLVPSRARIRIILAGFSEPAFPVCPYAAVSCIQQSQLCSRG